MKRTPNQHIDIIFLVDSSTSVGKNNFVEEIKFVKKLLSDFTVDSNHTRVSVITFSSRERVIRHLDYFADVSDSKHKCSLLQEDLRNIDYSGGGTFTLGAFKEAKVCAFYLHVHEEYRNPVIGIKENDLYELFRNRCKINKYI